MHKTSQTFFLNLEVLYTPMTKMACRLEDLRMRKGSKGRCEAATNICSAIQVRKSGQIKRMQCEGIEGTCECKRRSTVASLATYL